jgi:hypothetical protein
VLRKQTSPQKHVQPAVLILHGEKNGKKTGIMLNTVVNHVKEKSH